jgi:hypothetical protein
LDLAAVGSNVPLRFFRFVDLNTKGTLLPQLKNVTKSLNGSNCVWEIADETFVCLWDVEMMGTLG